MHQTFDRKVPLIEQRMRVANMKQPGRKHHHKKGPTRSHEERLTAKRNQENLNRAHKRFRDKVRAYWAGERDSYPTKGAP